MAKSRGFPSSDTHLTVGWVVRASQNLPSRRSGLTCPPRATTASPAAVLLKGPLAIGTNQGSHTCSSLNVLPTRAFPGGTPRTFSCEGAPRILAQAFFLQRFPPAGGAAIPMAEARGLRRSARKVNIDQAGRRTLFAIALQSVLDSPLPADRRGAGSQAGRVS